MSKPTLTPYDTGAALEAKPWIPYGTEVTETTPAQNFGKVNFEDDAGETVCVVKVVRTEDGKYVLEVDPLCNAEELSIVVHEER